MSVIFTKLLSQFCCKSKLFLFPHVIKRTGVQLSQIAKECHASTANSPSRHIRACNTHSTTIVVELYVFASTDPRRAATDDCVQYGTSLLFLSSLNLTNQICWTCNSNSASRHFVLPYSVLNYCNTFVGAVLRIREPETCSDTTPYSK